MKQLFFVNNLVSSATITATTTNAQFPVSNLKDDRRTKVFRSTSNMDSIIFDLGLLKDVDAVLMVDSGMTAFGFTEATVQTSVTNSWDGVPEIPVFIDHQFSFSELIFDETKNVRYVKLNLKNTSGYCEVSKIFIGEKISVGELSFSYPITFSQNTNASRQMNRMGQMFIDEVNTQKEIEGSFNTINKEEFEDLMKILDQASFTSPVWLWFPDGQMTTNNHRLSGYYFLKDDPQFQLIPANYWNVKLSFREGM